MNIKKCVFCAEPIPVNCDVHNYKKRRYCSTWCVGAMRRKLKFYNNSMKKVCKIFGVEFRTILLADFEKRHADLIGTYEVFCKEVREILIVSMENIK